MCIFFLGLFKDYYSRKCLIQLKKLMLFLYGVFILKIDDNLNFAGIYLEKYII